MLRDNVTEEIKKRRLSEMFEILHKYQRENNEKEIGKRHLILIEGESRKSSDELSGKTCSNKKIYIPNNILNNLIIGDFVEVEGISYINYNSCRNVKWTNIVKRGSY
jgi:tRNA-2-methylthio-N6-dimethylallyladenosine synthase